MSSNLSIPFRIFSGQRDRANFGHVERNFQSTIETNGPIRAYRPKTIDAESLKLSDRSRDCLAIFRDRSSDKFGLLHEHRQRKHQPRDIVRQKRERERERERELSLLVAGIADRDCLESAGSRRAGPGEVQLGYYASRKATLLLSFSRSFFPSGLGFLLGVLAHRGGAIIPSDVHIPRLSPRAYPVTSLSLPLSLSLSCPRYGALS